MRKIEIELTEEEHRNLMIFLGRSDLKGNEVPAFNSIICKLNPERKDVKEDVKQVLQPDPDQ